MLKNKYTTNYRNQLQIKPEYSIYKQYKVPSNNFESIKQYWLNLFGSECLGEDKTVRIVVSKGKKDASGNIDGKSNVSTSYQKISNFMDLKKFISNTSKHDDSNITTGYSMSSATFKYVTGDAPSLKSFVKTRTLILDLDAFIDNTTKQRFITGELTDIHSKFIMIQILNHFNEKLAVYGIPPLSTRLDSSCVVSGGGFQYIINFGEIDPISGEYNQMYKDDAQLIFSMYKNVIGSKDRFIVKLFEPTILNGEVDLAINDIYIEGDESFGDIVHAQRVGGTINQKYDVSVSILDVFGPADTHKNVFEPLYNIVSDLSLPTMSDTRQSIINKIYHTYEKFEKLSDDSDYTIQNLKNIAKTINNIKSQTSGTLGSKVNQGELQLLRDLPCISEVFLGKIEYVERNTSYIRCLCPIHNEHGGVERNPSFEMYLNHSRGMFGNIDYAVDEHDGEKYNIISLWSKIHNIDKQTAINQLVDKYNLSIDTKVKKDLDKAVTEELVTKLIAEINIENQVFYRLASKKNACIVRKFDSGASYQFDGPEILSDAILTGELNIPNPDGELRKLFFEEFKRVILIDAFEMYLPGEESVFIRDDINHVNLWVPSENYLRIHDIAANLKETPITETISIIKDECPNLYIFLLQITQKGSLEYFVNWLAINAQFKVSTCVPVMTSEFGAGKNVFVEHVLEYYLNSEFVNVVNTDKLKSNFNSFMEKSSLIVVDEGDFQKARDFDLLKFITGNMSMQIERKGIDSVKRQRFFNLIMFTNGDKPVHHPISERRITYFRLDNNLNKTISYLDKSTGQFLEDIKSELDMFWAVCVKTKINKVWLYNNVKDNQFNIQVLKSHSFGEFLLKMIQGDKQGIRLQLNEKVTDSASVQANLEMMDKIDKSFEEGGHISITLINKYLEAVNFKSYINIVEFIKINQLEEHGVNYVASNNKVSIVVDKEKMHNFTKMTNNLSTMFPEKFKTKTETKTINQPEINRKSRIRRRTPEPPSTPIMPGA